MGFGQIPLPVSRWDYFGCFVTRPRHCVELYPTKNAGIYNPLVTACVYLFLNWGEN